MYPEKGYNVPMQYDVVDHT